jgi:putative flippase GtrA
VPARRRTGSFLALHRPNLPAVPSPGPESGPFVGPPTSAQMMALRHLEYIADAQGSALDTALVPLRAGRRGLTAAVWGARRRLLTFAVNGLIVFVAGLALQIALIKGFGLSHVVSYVIQTVLSVQLNFMLSRFITWRERSVPFGGALVRFNLQQLVGLGLGLALYAGLERFGLYYPESNIVVTAVLTPVSFVAGHRWSMAERTSSRASVRELPWPLFLVLAVQVLLSLRLVWSNTPFLDEATYLYVGSQEINHWIHGVPVNDFQQTLSGAPVVYPPLAAMFNAAGGLAAARLLSLAFMVGTTALLYFTTKRLFDSRAAILAAALFAALAGTQFLSALATFDSMSLFLLVLATYMAVGRENAYDTLTDVACSTVIAAFLLALANADKYTTALWDPVIVGLACCAPPMAGYPWRYGVGRALRFSVTVATFLVIGIAIGKAKYLHGILFTTVARSGGQVGMNQPASVVLHDAWNWVGVVIVLTLAGAGVLLASRRRFPAAAAGSLAVLAALLTLAAVAAPLNQARIGTAVSLHKHVIFGAWFGCVLAGYGLSRLFRTRVLIGACAGALALGLATADAATAGGFYDWPTENPAFVTALKKLIRPGDEKYLISGYDDIPGYYAGDILSIQWKEAGQYAYTDPQTGAHYLNGPAFADAIRHRVFTLVILDFTASTPTEPTNDYLVARDIAAYGGYKVIGHLPPSDTSSPNYYTVWRVIGGK